MVILFFFNEAPSESNRNHFKKKIKIKYIKKKNILLNFRCMRNNCKSYKNTFRQRDLGIRKNPNKSKKKKPTKLSNMIAKSYVNIFDPKR